MRVRVGCEFVYAAPDAAHAVLQVEPRYDSAFDVVDERWELDPDVDTRSYIDGFGNRCLRLTIPRGRFVLRYDAVVRVPEEVDETDVSAVVVPADELPDDALLFTLPSRFCPSDLLADEAWRLFGGTVLGWPRVQAACDWVHENIQFEYGSSTPMTSALDVYERRRGVCRDFAHLFVTFCRALGIPARYAFGYLPDIAVPPPFEPMDFCAWTEVFLGGKWFTFDPRNNQRRVGRVLIGRGRDALDVAMVTTFGAPVLEQMVVWADEETVGAAS
jgi:transglutaminase-like putative cysteine protease